MVPRSTEPSSTAPTRSSASTARSSAGPRVVGIFPNDDAIVRCAGAILLKQNDEWAVQRARYMTLETVSQMSDDSLQAKTRRCGRGIAAPTLDGSR
ncbi:hypothetical protein MESS2_p30005 [Mesorhizobium metallidurans STM 2683]|uniref:Transposase n=1 Tax=Mesorhizobium metallidurans STM 2683 TaxID=1297569 RepID=M5F005_9HYPH|nr:hypothetical protein MESS2_p30005 [Mesorhizobium metallidurans STM 2683]